jgi:predicted membrane protein (TIGR00267 family)
LSNKKSLNLQSILSFPIRIIDEIKNDEYVRRAFANNAFDGALTFLGILMGNMVLDEFNPSVVIKIGLSTCLAIGMSGSFGRFLSERAERKHALRQIEKSMLTDLDGSMLAEEGKNKTFMVSFIDGISPALALILPVFPFFLANANLISVQSSIVLSFILVILVLFGLGVFLGITSDENAFLYGLGTVAVGFFTSLIIFLSSIYLG